MGEGNSRTDILPLVVTTTFSIRYTAVGQYRDCLWASTPESNHLVAGFRMQALKAGDMQPPTTSSVEIT